MTDPILVFDGRCGMCTRSVFWVLKHLREGQQVRALPYQRMDLAAHGLTEDDASRAAWWISTDGKKRRGHLAIAKALMACRQPWPIAGALLFVPPIRWLAAAGYWWIARNRSLFPGTTPACKRGWDMDRGRPA